MSDLKVQFNAVLTQIQHAKQQAAAELEQAKQQVEKLILGE